ERLNVFAQLRRGRQDFVQAFDLAVTVVEFLACLRREEYVIQESFELLVLAAFKRCQVTRLRFAQQTTELHQQQVQVLDHAGYVLRVERQRLVQITQHADEIDDQSTRLLAA